MSSSSSSSAAESPPHLAPSSSSSSHSSSRSVSSSGVRGRGLAAGMGMAEQWERIVSLIPPAHRSTPEQQQRLMNMQMSMLMGVKAMGNQVSRGTGRPPHRSSPHPHPFGRGRRPPMQEEEKKEEEGKEEAEEDEEEELDEEDLEDEEGDDEEVLAIKAEIRRVKAEKAAAASTATPSPPPLPTTDDLAEFAHQLVHPTIDDPD